MPLPLPGISMMSYSEFAMVWCFFEVLCSRRMESGEKKVCQLDGELAVFNAGAVRPPRSHDEVRKQKTRHLSRSSGDGSCIGFASVVN